MTQSIPTALITGGSRRVGRAVAERLSAEGFAVAITYRTSREDAVELADAHGMLTIQADFENPEAAARTVSEAFSAKFDRLDVLVHNASLYEPSSLWQTDVAQMRRFFAVHAETPLLLTRSLSPLLKAAKGLVVSMSDIQIARPDPRFAAYAMSKAALDCLTRALARELAPDVRVNAIAPGVVAWPEAFDPKQIEAYLARIPLGRDGTPQDVASLIHYLATQGRYITGQTLNVDGGRSIRA